MSLSRGQAEWLAREAGEAADQSIAAAIIAKEAAESIPKPDPRDDVNFQRLAGLEQSMLARISPRHRNRWPELVAIDRRLEEIDLGQERVRVKLADLHERRERADGEHAAALATWMGEGQKGPKPVSEVAALEGATAEAQAEFAALDFRRDRILEERVAYVEKHRKSLSRDARKAVEQAKQDYLAAIDAVERTRQELVGLRETEIWASLFPSDLLLSFPPSHVLAGGRRRETDRHFPGLRRELPVHDVLGLLRTDATYCSTVATVEQAAAIEGKTKSELTGNEAMWAGSPEDLARQKWWKEKVIEEHQRAWGQPPAEYSG